MKPQVDPEHYSYNSYDVKERFISYWHQIDEIKRVNPQKALEIGIGNGFVSKYLKEKRLDLDTLDIDIRLKPDIGGSVLNLPFYNDSYDVVACYETLEHLPYENFSEALLEMFRVAKSYVIISLPDANGFCRFIISIPKIKTIKELINCPKFRPLMNKFDGEHYWEIGKAGYPLKRIINDIEISGFRIERTYRIFEHPLHRFFILKKVIVAG